MDALAQRIAPAEEAGEPFGKGLDDGNLESKPDVLNPDRERPALMQEALGAVRERMDTDQQRRRSSIGAKHLHCGAGRGKRIERDVDAIEIAVVLAAILQVVD